MAKKLRPGGVVNGYEILQLVNDGAQAISYAAKTPAGEKVFFKQYKSPTVTVSWYRAFVEYQQELKRRIESTPAQRFTYRLIASFEAQWGHLCFFQVFEFVEEGHDLEKALDQIRANPASVSWERRVTFAKVIMACINAFHVAGIVHCDLKPPNILLFKDDTIDAGYVVKLIDLDFSILTDRQAPWHAYQGYVGTPGYFSPEHAVPDAAPVPASDVFTCGLILYELLGQGHPYRFDLAEDYNRAVLGHTASRPKLRGTMPAPANNADVEEILYRCLAPDPTMRPTARDIVLVLNGRPIESAPKRSPTAPAAKPDPSGTTLAKSSETPIPVDSTFTPTSIISEPRLVQSLTLVAESGRTLEMSVRTPIGKHLLKPFGDDHVFYDPHQFTLERDESDGRWYVAHCPTAKHQTLLNGKKISGRVPLDNGDVLAVGDEARAIQKLPMKVRVS